MTTIKRIENATRNLGAPPDWDGESMTCHVLPIRDVEVQGMPFMVSAWELSEQELAALMAGETLKLWIQGYTHPVVAITVGDIDG